MFASKPVLHGLFPILANSGPLDDKVSADKDINIAAKQSPSDQKPHECRRWLHNPQ